jgi:hypothetical protein
MSNHMKAAVRTKYGLPGDLTILELDKLFCGE